MRRRIERGASTLEYLGVLVVGVLVVTGLVLAAPGWGGSIAAAADRAICQVTSFVGGSGCAQTSISGPHEASDGSTGDPYRDRRWTRDEVTGGNFVFIGDSYGSGEGARDYDPETDRTGENTWWDDLLRRDPGARNMCHRSDNASYHRISEGWFSGQNSTFGACSGARTGDYWDETQGNDEPAQRDHLDSDTSLVVVSMGGNDMQFADVLQSCAPVGGGRVDNCMGHWDDPQVPGDPSSSRWEENLTALFGDEPGGGSLGAVYDDIRNQTGDNAHVVIVGYPRIFDENYDGIVFSNEEAMWMNGKADLLNARLRAHAEHYGFTFIDPTEAFAGNGVGSDDPWILTFGFWGDHRAQPPEAYHPTARGQEEIARLIDEYLATLP
ncbi:SGNH/GDSL hydrolase family protein [Ornithinimicrobium sp. Y1847]|uniref:SGNH/GDSL hydrolase family protein n=1 Tax=Ornithinimicrobium sp. Y1847 TaxID=3405419 RepID=UPI003B675CFE